MKEIEKYLTLASEDISCLFDVYFISKDNTKHLRYNYEEIVKDYIMEHELYKYKYDEEKITEKIFEWFSQQNLKINNNLQCYFKFTIETEVSYFHSQNLELFMLGELNHESGNMQ